MAKTNIVPLTFENDWERHVYRADGRIIENMRNIYSKDKKTGAFEKVKIKSSEESVSYGDMGHTYNAWSTHYYVEAVVMGVKIEIPLVDFINKKPKMFYVDVISTQFVK